MSSLPNNLMMKAWLLATYVFAVATADFSSVALDGRLAGATLEYKVTPNDPDANGMGTVTVRYTVPQLSWVAVGVSTDGSGKMVPGEVVLAMPEGNNIQKYSLSGYAPAGVTPMANQTLISPTLQQVDGSTILTFTKLMAEEGEYIFTPNSNTTFIASFGSSNAFGAHVGFGNATVLLEADTEAPTMAPVVAPTEAPDSEGFRAVGAFISVFLGALLSVW